MNVNPGKNRHIHFGKQKYARLPIKTHIISKDDIIAAVVQRYAKPHIKRGDTLVISERVVAITQGRMYAIADIVPSRPAQILHRFVSKHPGGIGLGSPWTMELAIREVGVPRIVLGALVAMCTRPFGIKGLFYRVVGGDINAIDGPTPYTVPPGDTSATLGPKNPEKVATSLSKKTGIGVAIIDANDYGVRIMGASDGVDIKLLEKLLKDNPLGQGREQTPMALIRDETKKTF